MSYPPINVDIIMEPVKIAQDSELLGEFLKSTYFRGLLFTRIEDTGPDITANFTNLDEGQALSLGVQAFTLIGVGTGSRSSGSWVDNIFGPMPVPTGQLMNSLVYPFLIDDQTSNDARIRSGGRSCAIIILVSRQKTKYDDLRDYLVQYLHEWTKNQDFSEERIKRLFYVIQNHSSLQVKEKEKISTDKVVSRDDQELKQALKERSIKISLLEHLVSLDSIGKALMDMYESSPNGGTVDQLSKTVGMSRIMLGWNLRKYVKAGLIQIENNNISFIKQEN